MSRLPNAWHLTTVKAEPPAEPAEDTGLADAPLSAEADEPTAPNPDLININEASKTQLVSLPGIGPASAEAIIENRPYTSVENMVEKASLTRLDPDDINAIQAAVTF
ncbi:MAG: helix-hairpin-helix domain-containing protein [Cyanobacteria bacterium P01_F01_bin.3]